MTRAARRPASPIDSSALRHAVCVMAELREPMSCFLPVRVVDISTTGCRAWTGFRLAEGRPVRLKLPGLPPLRAVTVWSEGAYAGFRLDAALHPAIPYHLAALYPPRGPSGTG